MHNEEEKADFPDKIYDAFLLAIILPILVEQIQMENIFGIVASGRGPWIVKCIESEKKIVYEKVRYYHFLAL